MSGQTYRVWLMEGNRTLSMDGVTGLIQDETGASAFFYREGKVYSRSGRDPFCTVVSDGRMVDDKGNQVGFIVDYPRFVRNQPGMNQQTRSDRGTGGKPAAQSSPPVRETNSGAAARKASAGEAGRDNGKSSSQPASPSPAASAGTEKKPGGRRGRVFLVLIAIVLAIAYFNNRPNQVKIPSSKYYAPVQNTFARNALISEGARQVYSEIEKKAYNTPQGENNALYKGSLNDKTTLTDVFLGWKAFNEDHPEVFWITFSSYLDGSGYLIRSIFPKAELEEKRAKLFSALQTVLDQVPSGLSGEKLEKYVHDYLIDHCEYDYAALNASGNVDPNYRNVDVVGKAYGPLVNHKAICAGYAQANQLLLNRLGVYCVPIFGRSGLHVYYGETNHEWNAVKSGSKWYMTDVTWDDGTASSAEKYRYFHLSIAEMEKDHTPAKLDQRSYVYSPVFLLNASGDTIFLPTK
ncbi:MAG: hypothetical protein IKE24_05395 [Clostridia bacterium]|nr:hypothetical protein [Clostridia bacterium]